MFTHKSDDKHEENVCSVALQTLNIHRNMHKIWFYRNSFGFYFNPKSTGFSAPRTALGGGEGVFSTPSPLSVELDPDILES